jgi:hypothetical protein
MKNKLQMLVLKRSNVELAEVFGRKAGIFHTETDRYKNRSQRKSNKKNILRIGMDSLRDRDIPIEAPTPLG